MKMQKTKIYIVCPEIKVPTGGVKQLYKLAETLSRNNMDVSLVHGKKGFRINWFETDVSIEYFPFLFHKINKLTRKKKAKYIFKDFFKLLLMDKSLPGRDAVIIYPEVYGPDVHTLLENRYIVYNQNCYYTFNLFPFMQKKEVDTYSSSRFRGFLTVSQDSANYLSQAFPDKKIERIGLGLHPVFSYSDKKEKIIAFMPRKLKEDVNQIYQILSDYPELKEWKWMPIDNKTEEQVAELLKKSALFLSFNFNEGFGLPPVEAMACGCYVIGYAGNAGTEYFLPEFSSRVADRNILEFADKIKEKVTEFNQNPLSLINQGKKASDFVRSSYTLQREEADSLKAIKNLLS